MIIVKFYLYVYFPFIYVLFVFILINNLIAMVPYSLAPASHFIFIFSLSFTVVLGATILGNLSLSITSIGLYLTIAGYLLFMILKFYNV